jgi:hypothetical protein
MSTTPTGGQGRPTRINLPPRTGAFTSSALETDDVPTPPASGASASMLTPPTQRQNAPRVSFSAVRHHRPSVGQRWRAIADEEGGLDGSVLDKPPIPSALGAAGDVTPLPILSMIVLSIVSWAVSFVAAGLAHMTMVHRRCWASFCPPTFPLLSF